jgi:hypothetical protein
VEEIRSASAVSITVFHTRLWRWAQQAVRREIQGGSACRKGTREEVHDLLWPRRARLAFEAPVDAAAAKCYCAAVTCLS